MVIISSTIDDEQLWARFAVCQGRKTGLNDKNQPVHHCPPLGVSIPGKKPQGNGHGFKRCGSRMKTHDNLYILMFYNFIVAVLDQGSKF